MHNRLLYCLTCFSLRVVGRRAAQYVQDGTYEEVPLDPSQDEALTNFLLAMNPHSVVGAFARPDLSPLSSSRSNNALMGRKSENNKERKAKTFLANTKKASLIGKKIKIALQSGETDPTINLALAAVMKEANAMNVKKDVVDRAIKAAADSDKADFKQLTYEIYGFGGAGIIVNALSDNSNRALNDVGTVAKKRGLKLASSGSVLSKFARKGRITLNTEISEDRMIELALESDVDDVELSEPCNDMRSDGDGVKSVIYTETSDLNAMVKALEAEGIECVGNLVYEPMFLAEGMSDEDFDLNMELVDKLEEVDDVDSVEHNIVMSA